MTTEIDAEVISEEKLPERPKEVRSVSLPLSAANAAASIADVCDKVGATNAANKVRAGVAMGASVAQTVSELKPAADAVKTFVQDLKDKGYLKMAPRRRALMT